VDRPIDLAAVQWNFREIRLSEFAEQNKEGAGGLALSGSAAYEEDGRSGEVNGDIANG
jgi:hypothetical protein